MGLIHAVFPRHRDRVDAPAQQLARAGAALGQSLNSPWLVEAVGQGPGVGLRAEVLAALARGSLPAGPGGTAQLRFPSPSVPCSRPLLALGCRCRPLPQPGARCGSPQGHEPELIPRPALPSRSGQNKMAQIPAGVYATSPGAL